MPSNHSFLRLGDAHEVSAEGSPPRAPAESALVAELRVHRGPHGPRRLLVCRRDADVVVRRLDGRLLWLETGTLSAVRAVDDPGRVVVEHGGPEESTLLLPHDHGVEGVAIASLESFCDSFDVDAWPQAPAGSTRRSEPPSGTVLRCTLEAYGACRLRVDDLTGLVVEVRAGDALADDELPPGSRPSLLMAITALREEPATAVQRWFEPRDL